MTFNNAHRKNQTSWNGSPADATAEAEANADANTVSCKVVIIGAGAAGLSCARQLLQSGACRNVQDIVILEARNRIGGRIYTTQETRNCLLASSQQQQQQQLSLCKDNSSPAAAERTVEFAMDHGAAWVHGTGDECWTTVRTATTTVETEESNNLPVEASPAMKIIPKPKPFMPHQPMPEVNPMMVLVEQACQDKNIPVQDMLTPVFPRGNSWMRPMAIGLKDEQLLMYVAGSLITDRQLIRQSMQQHFQLMQAVSDTGNSWFRMGRGLDTAFVSVDETIHTIQTMQQQQQQQSNTTTATTSAAKNIESELSQQQKIVNALVPFYRYMIECWYGKPMDLIQLCEFTADDDEDDNDAADVENEHSDGENFPPDDSHKIREEKKEPCIAESTPTTETSHRVSNSSSSSRMKVKTDEQYNREGDFYGPHCTVTEGMAALLEPLLKNGMADRILLNQEVTRIRNGNDQDNAIVVETAAGMTVRASDCVVVTLSVGCLDEVVHRPGFLDPPLSTPKMEAIRVKEMGTYKKVFLTFDHIFWPIQPPFLGLVRSIQQEQQNTNKDIAESSITSTVGNYLLLDNLWACRGIPCIEAILSGHAGQWATHKSDEEIRTTVLDFMVDAMGLPDRNAILESCIDCHITRWEEDPYSRGAYSAVALGCLGRHIEDMQRPEWNGRFILAGEATVAEYEGSVHAALMSGDIAAEHVLAYQQQQQQQKAGTTKPHSEAQVENGLASISIAG